MVQDVDEFRKLRNLVPKIRRDFNQTKIASTENSTIRKACKDMKSLMGINSCSTNDLQCLANKCTGGGMNDLAKRFVISESSDIN